jgi:hypothetical protein
MNGAMRLLRPEDLAWAHALNQAHAVELSSETPEAFAARVERACVALAAGNDLGFLLAYNQKPAEISANFDWLAERVTDFVYIDRVVIAGHARGHGLARRFYEALFGFAAGLGAARITCEVNLDPPNPASDAFHEALEFREIGQNRLETVGKTVRYLAREL